MTTFKQKDSQFIRVENALIDFGRKGEFKTDDKKLIDKLNELGYGESQKPKKSTKEV